MAYTSICKHLHVYKRPRLSRGHGGAARAASTCICFFASIYRCLHIDVDASIYMHMLSTPGLDTFQRHLHVDAFKRI